MFVCLSFLFCLVAGSFIWLYWVYVKVFPTLRHFTEVSVPSLCTLCFHPYIQTQWEYVSVSLYMKLCHWCVIHFSSGTQQTLRLLEIPAETTPLCVKPWSHQSSSQMSLIGANWTHLASPGPPQVQRLTPTYRIIFTTTGISQRIHDSAKIWFLNLC